MFRVITTYTPPSFFVMCDNRNCNSAVTEVVTPEVLKSNEENQKRAIAFVEARKLEGWAWGMTGQFCPGCEGNRREVERAAKEAQTGIIVPGAGDISRMKKGGLN